MRSELGNWLRFLGIGSIILGLAYAGLSNGTSISATEAIIPPQPSIAPIPDGFNPTPLVPPTYLPHPGCAVINWPEYAPETFDPTHEKVRNAWQAAMKANNNTPIDGNATVFWVQLDGKRIPIVLNAINKTKNGQQICLN